MFFIRRFSLFVGLVASAFLLGGCANLTKFVEKPTVDDLHLAPITSVEEVMESQMMVAPEKDMAISLVPISAQWRKTEFVFKTLQKPNGDPVPIRRMVSRVIVCNGTPTTCDERPWSGVWTEEGSYALMIPSHLVDGAYALVLSADGKRVMTTNGKIVRISLDTVIKNPRAFFSLNPSPVHVLTDEKKRGILLKWIETQLPERTVRVVDGRHYWTTPVFVQAAGISNMDKPEHRFWASGGATIGSGDILGGGVPLAFKVGRTVYALNSAERVGAFAPDEENEARDDSQQNFSGVAK